MPNLHTHFLNGNVKAFRQELDGTAGGSIKNVGGGGGGGASGVGPGSASGGGKSWIASGMAMHRAKADPNERDMWGRTVLHLASSSSAPIAYNFLQILLRHPQIQVNAQDVESGYTALHRALFAGNIRASRDLMARTDIDPMVKDAEGMAAYDLYNGTVNGTNPPQGADGTDLFVWGVNRNFALGTGDTSDKAFPDRIQLLTQAQAAGRSDPWDKFSSIGVHDVVMSKLHSGVITTESRGNLSLCGFGANGRLGKNVHSQLALTPLADVQATIVAIALGQDHTLALTSGGYVLSWGHNRFSQLGYTIEPGDRPAGVGKDVDDLVQVSPKRIVGFLKKEFVKGVSAGRMASACWTADAVWTWGTNTGHLGYDKASNHIQPVPRRVPSLTQPVVDIAFSDYAMICLLGTSEVVCFHDDGSFKVSFSIPRHLPEAFPFRPPQTTLKPMIIKVTSSSSHFAALSSIGDVFTFSLPNPLEKVNKDGRHTVVKPQIVWALRKNFTAVKDVAIGSDGTVIVCTHSGHVFVRQRFKSGSGQLKFRRIPYLQRIIKVACNESGAFAAVRVDARPTPIKLMGNTLEEDLFSLQPHFRRFEHQMTEEDFERLHAGNRVDDDEEEEDESTNSVVKDTAVALKMCAILSRWRTAEGDSLFAWGDPLLNSDCHLLVAGFAIPAHSDILCLRASKLSKVLAGEYASELLSLRSHGPSPAIEIKACHPLVGLLLLQYLYSDEVATVWDPRVARVLEEKYKENMAVGDIKENLKAVADELELVQLSSVLFFAGKQPIPKKTIAGDLQAFFDITSTIPAGADSPCDVQIQLADKNVSCSSVILRARCPFFEAMLNDDDWTVMRRGKGGVVSVKMMHLKWTVMKLVFRWIYEGREDDLFDYLHQDTLDDFLDFVFEVLAAATELLLDRLVLVCSRAIILHCNAFNASALATEASFYQATTLKLSVFSYIISNLETMLESGFLDEMPVEVLQDLESVIEQRQRERMPLTRNELLVKGAMAKHKDWLLLQDIPAPIVRQPFRWRAKSTMSPVDITAVKPTPRRKPPPSALFSPEVTTSGKERSTAADGIFQMDDDPPTPASSASGADTPRSGRAMVPLDLGAHSQHTSSPVPWATGTPPKAIWKSKTVETGKNDLRSIMAEAEAAKAIPKSAKRTNGFTLSTPVTSGKSQHEASKIPLEASSSGPGMNGPWKKAEVRKTSFALVQGQQGQAPSASQSTSQRSAARVITPVKVSPASLGSLPRKSSAAAGSSGSAWSTPTTFIPPSIPSSTFSPPTAGISLLAIQQQEEQRSAEAKKAVPKKSLKEIQEEEKEREREKREEDDFMKWWQEEEARVSAAANGQAPSGSAARIPDQKQANGRGRGRGRGKGRGRGGAVRAGQGANEKGIQKGGAPP